MGYGLCMEKKCKYCNKMYRIKPSVAEKSKFCSRHCHDKGKTYSDGRSRKSKEQCIKLRTSERLSVNEIAERMKLTPRTVATHVNGYPLTNEEYQARRKAKNRKTFDEASTIICKKKRLLEKRGHSCEQCGRKTWQKEQIPLELHHKDGNKLNNRKENLILLCLNCHGLTDTWRSRNRSKQGPVAKR